MQTYLTPWITALACAFAAGCDSDTVKLLRDGEVVAVLTTELTRDVDLLFVVDNTGSMAEEQAALLGGFGSLTAELSELAGGAVDGALPNLHVGVISTDLGAGPFNISGCSGQGDGGVLQTRPRQVDCAPPDGAFISDIEQVDGARTVNYTGTLDEAFGCIARLGIDGCGFEQPLESMRRALDGSNPENAGFLRPEAWLAIVILTDEDDCSTENTQMFDTSQGSIDDPLGPLASFRCFEFGVVCDPDDPRTLGAKTACKPRAGSQYMFDVARYTSFLGQLKADPSQVFVAGIIGNPTPVTVGADQNDGPKVEPSCQSSTGDGFPGVRLAAFARSFPARHTLATVCNDDLASVLSDIGRRLRHVIESSPCLEGAISNPVRCTVEDALGYGTEFEQRVDVPECDNLSNPAAAGNQPCHVIAADRARCPDTRTGLAATVYPLDRTVPGGTRVVVKCAVD